jgi:hypothetical protein
MIFKILQIISAIFILFLPGYLLSNIKGIKGFEKMALAIGFSISINVFLSIILGLTGLFNSFNTYLTLTIISIILFFIKRKNIFEKNKFYRLKFEKRHILIILILIATFTITYSPHFNYEYPIHADEFYFVGKITQTIDNSKYIFTDPISRERWKESNVFQMGAYTLGSEIFLLTGLDPFTDFRFLAAIFACLTSFVLFTFAYKMTNSFYAGIFAMIFFASLKSNVNILGPIFFVPFNICFPLIFLFFYYFTKIHEGKKFFFIFITLFITTLFIHAALFLFSLPILLIYEISRGGKAKKAFLISFILIILILCSYVFLDYKSQPAYNKMKFSEITKEIIKTKLVYEDQNKITYEWYTFYGIMASLLAIIGIVICIKRHSRSILLFWSIISLAIIYFNKFFGFTPIIRFERLMFYTILGLITLSAIGLEYLVSISIKHFKKRKSLILFLILWLGLIFAGIFYNYFEKQAMVTTFHYINDKEYDALLWIKDKYGTENIIITPSGLNYAVYPSTKNYAFCHQFEDCKWYGVKEFYANITDCDKNYDFLKKYNFDADLIIHNNEVNCSHLKLVYNNSPVLIYEVKKD